MKKKLLIACVVLALSLTATACGSSETETNETTQQEATQEVTEQEETTQTETTEVPEPNTTEKILYIYQQAKDEFENGVSDEKRNEAVQFLVDTYPNYFVDNETMEKTMYHGRYLELSYREQEENRTYATLGMNACQAVKYVYRGAETVEDEATQINLEQIKESLQELGFSI